MKKLLYTIAITAIAGTFVCSCGKEEESDWEQYAEWRAENEVWYEAQANRTNEDGTPYFTRLQPDWYPQSGVLIHYVNDRALTEQNLSPMITSDVTVKYKGTLCNGTVFDATTTGSDSARTFTLSETIIGWQIALTDMRVGDSCEVVLPYAQAYGVQGTSSGVSPYSILKFNIKLMDIPKYEIP